MPARLTPTWRVIVRIEMEGGWYGLLPETSIARHAIEACGRFRGAAHHGTARRRRIRLLKTSSTLLFTGLAGPYASN
jgi:hypothetical protein